MEAGITYENKSKFKHKSQTFRLPAYITRIIQVMGVIVGYLHVPHSLKNCIEVTTKANDLPLEHNMSLLRFRLNLEV
jgi:hypothetical protein